MNRCAGQSGRVAVVIPLYGQAQFLVETVASVLRQTLQSVVTVIVNDGCPDPASHAAGSSLALAHPERVFYLHQQNRGLSGARNTGINWALARFPDLEAVFPLDSDNYLDEDALELLLDRLRADESVDWVSPHLRLFGAANRPWQLVPRFTRFRQLFENQADAAALFRAEVFRLGAIYDEHMRHGYEDWELYLAQLLDGRHGVSEPTATMFYRSRTNSMLSEAVERHESIRSYMRAKHRRWYLPRGRTRLEHDEFPRFALIDEFGRLQTFTDPSSPGLPLEDDATARTPITVIGVRGVIEELRRNRLISGLLFTCQPSHRSEATVIVIDKGPMISIERSPSRNGLAAAVLVVPTDLLHRTELDESVLESALRDARQVTITLPSPEWTCSPGWNEAQLLGQALSAGRRLTAIPDDERTDQSRGYLSDDDFIRHLHEQVVLSTFPLMDDGHRHLGFAMPWLKLGGVEHCVLQVSQALRRLDPTLRIHLALTEDGGIATNPTLTTAVFDSITSFAELPHDRRVTMVDRWSSSMDVVINAHSGVAFDSVDRKSGWPRSERHTLNAAYLHVLDLTPGGMRLGWPIIAAQLDGGIDRFLVISRAMSALMRNEGVTPRKIVIGPNAPVIRPESLEVAENLADEKAARLAAGGQLRILIAGRLDYQKGGRRAAHAIRALAENGHDFHVSVLGSPTLEAELPDLPLDKCTWRSATTDANELSTAFAQADVLLLLSRWEGVPLAMLDAMAHGTVVVATDVGAIAEVVSHGQTAHLIPCNADADDEAVGAAAAALLATLLDDETGGQAMRRRAVSKAWSMSWDDTAERILEMVEDSWKDQQR